MSGKQKNKRDDPGAEEKPTAPAAVRAGRAAAASALSDVEGALTAALDHHRAGRLDEAQALYRKILLTEPSQADALHLLGVLYAQSGDNPRAASLVEQAIGVNPNNAAFHSNLANVYKTLGRLPDAMAAYRRALAVDPNHHEAHINLGNALKAQGRLEEAVASYQKAIALEPNIAEAHYNLGNALKEQGKLAAAVASYQNAIALKPNYAEAHINLGNALKEQGRLEEAIASYQKAIALKPNYAEAHYNLGVALQEQGRLKEAIASYQKAIALKPNYAEAHNNLGNALRVQGKVEEAVAAYRKALELKPDYAAAHNNLGNALRGQGKVEEAVAAYRKALELKPDYAVAQNNLGVALLEQGKLADAVAAYRKALELKPDYAGAQSNQIFCMHYDPRFTVEDIFAESRHWNDLHALPRAAGARAHANSREPGRRLRVGYVSPDFREHSVSYFFEPLIRAHDRRSFEVFCYAEVAKPHDKTARFRGLADGWRSTVGLADAAVADRVREDGIDILVDLAGHTAKNRLLVFAARPAPVQVTWLGYPNTTGLSAMDYRLTDAIADPEGPADALHSETLARLPGGFLCYLPPADAPQAQGPPALARGHVTFGSFNYLPKVTPEVVKTWASILDRVPGSRLLIKSRPLADEGTRERYLEMFAAQGIAAGRIELVSWIPSRSGHLAAYEKVDIALDPFPYNGTTTTFEALWMGVPVITLRGGRHAGRVGTSILTRMALREFVAETKAAYVEKAVGLANDLGRLSVLRRDLRGRLRASRLCDAEGFTREVEAAYRAMWRCWCEGSTIN